MGKLKILILGDGLLGSEIHKQSGWNFLSRKKDNIDAKKFDEWSSKLDEYSIIINCIANTDTYSKEKENHWILNYQFVHQLINYCNKQNKKLVHISTDYIYSGSIENASENDVPVHSNNWYSYTKLLGDSLVQLLSTEYLICRLSHKKNPFPYEKAWVDIKTNCDYVDVISQYVIKLIENNTNGVFNVGTELKSIYDLAIKTKNVDPINKPHFVPSDTSMSLDKLLNNFK
jgi:dTDP-4-dehydrorhamnose reductase